MKPLKQKLIIFGAAIAMILSGITIIANAELEDQGDIVHHLVSTDGTTWVYEYSNEARDDIDIKEITYSNDGTTLTVTMEVYGTIQTSLKHAYMLYYNTTDATYVFMWLPSGGIATGWDFDFLGMDVSEIPIEDLPTAFTTGTFTAEGSILTGEITLLGSGDADIIWGYTQESLISYDSITDPTQVEWWQDYYPETFAPWYEYDFDTGDDGDDDDTGDGDTGDDGDDDDNGDGDNGDEGSGEGGTDSGDTSSAEKTPGFEIITLIAAIAVAVILLKKKK